VTVVPVVATERQKKPQKQKFIATRGRLPDEQKVI
jgi:hypothetical protein